MRARYAASRAALERLDELAVEEWTRDDTIERMRGLYEFRQRRVKVRTGKLEDEDGIEERSLAYQRLMHELYAVQRRAARRAAQRRRDQQRRDAPDRAGARPRGVAAGELSASAVPRYEAGGAGTSAAQPQQGGCDGDSRDTAGSRYRGRAGRRRRRRRGRRRGRPSRGATSSHPLVRSTRATRRPQGRRVAFRRSRLVTRGNPATRRAVRSARCVPSADRRASNGPACSCSSRWPSGPCACLRPARRGPQPGRGRGASDRCAAARGVRCAATPAAPGPRGTAAPAPRAAAGVAVPGGWRAPSPAEPGSRASATAATATSARTPGASRRSTRSRSATGSRSPTPASTRSASWRRLTGGRPPANAASSGSSAAALGGASLGLHRPRPARARPTRGRRGVARPER